MSKKSEFLERLSGKKNASGEALTLFQFRFPKSYAEKLKMALEAKGLKPRDIFEAAADLIIEEVGPQRKEESRSDKAKSILRREGPGRSKNA